MVWKPTEAQLKRARASIAAEKRERLSAKRARSQKKKRVRFKQKRTKKATAEKDYVTQRFIQMFGAGGAEPPDTSASQRVASFARNV